MAEPRWRKGHKENPRTERCFQPSMKWGDLVENVFRNVFNVLRGEESKIEPQSRKNDKSLTHRRGGRRVSQRKSRVLNHEGFMPHWEIETQRYEKTSALKALF